MAYDADGCSDYTGQVKVLDGPIDWATDSDSSSSTDSDDAQGGARKCLGVVEKPKHVLSGASGVVVWHKQNTQPPTHSEMPPTCFSRSPAV